jgi:signal peptidase
MNPALKFFDITYAIPYKGQKIRRGDVIVFIPPGEDHKVTHRVIFADSKVIKTRGDSSPNADPWVLSPDDIHGTVICAQRRNRQLRIYGGLSGRLFHLMCRIKVRVKSFKPIRMIMSAMLLMVRTVYHWFEKFDILKGWFSSMIEMRVISLERPAGTELQLVIGRRVIGRRLPGKCKYQIRPPFRLFVDEASLPM